MSDLIRRALAIHRRRSGSGASSTLYGDITDQELVGSGRVLRRRSYVSICSGYRMLAVYRVRPCGRLRPLRRWPTYFVQVMDVMELVEGLDELDRVEATQKRGTPCSNRI